jgi:hypothetical protein
MAFYFGFPSTNYVAQIQELQNTNVPIGRGYAQNRRFNCMDCGERGINHEKSKPPYIVICNE